MTFLKIFRLFLAQWIMIIYLKARLGDVNLVHLNYLNYLFKIFKRFTRSQFYWISFDSIKTWICSYTIRKKNQKFFFWGRYLGYLSFLSVLMSIWFCKSDFTDSSKYFFSYFYHWSFLFCLLHNTEKNVWKKLIHIMECTMKMCNCGWAKKCSVWCQGD